MFYYKPKFGELQDLREGPIRPKEELESHLLSKEKICRRYRKLSYFSLLGLDVPSENNMNSLVCSS